MKSPIITAVPGKKLRLRDVNTDSTGGYKSKDDAKQRLGELQERLSTLQEALYAEHRQSLLIVLQAMDTGGKDGAIKAVLRGVNPIGVHVTSFKAPTAEELDHDFLWRVHQSIPGKGMMGVWNRSHYEDVLIVRVHDLVEKKVWQSRYDHINAFEKLLAESGVKLLKFFLHISKDEQKERLQARLDDPTKHWKFNPHDLDERKLWDDYQQAYEDAINRCSTEYAPWHVVPADHKWSRNLAVAETVVAALEEMNPRYPQADFDPKSIVIE